MYFDLENRNKRDAKNFENISKTFVLNDDKLVNDLRFSYLEYVSNRRFVNENWANHERVQHSSFVKDDISCERRHFCENHELLYHFLLNFSYMRISFQTNVDLNLQNSYVDFRLYDARLDLDRDYHVELFWIFEKMNQFVFNRDEQEFVSNRSSFAELVYSFQIFAIFIRAFVVNQNVHIVCVSQRLRINFEFVAHFQQISIVKQIKNEKRRKSLKNFIRIKNETIILRFIVKIVVRFWKKLIIQSIIHFDIFLFRRSWINRSCKIVSNVLITRDSIKW
jgi:hypothetical protein